MSIIRSGQYRLWQDQMSMGINPPSTIPAMQALTCVYGHHPPSTIPAMANANVYGHHPPNTIPAMASAKSWLIKPTLPRCITYPASSEHLQPKTSHTGALIMGIIHPATMSAMTRANDYGHHPPSDNVGYDTR